MWCATHQSIAGGTRARRTKQTHIPSIRQTFASQACSGFVRTHIFGTGAVRPRGVRCETTTKDLEAHELRTNRNLVDVFRPDDQVRRYSFSCALRRIEALQMGGVYRAARSRSFAD